ncbi:MAG TPA: hypothetical protein DIW46_06450 [Microbacterium sp.]|nr:hypothetical protein [Microbacterium sp.]
MSRALRDDDADFARRLISEAANDRFEFEESLFALSGHDAWDALLLSAMAYSFNRGVTAPAWTRVAALDHATYLAPEQYLDDAWRAEIRSATPHLFASRNIWLTANDLAVA